VPAPQEFGSYRLYDRLGVGGMASVHVAESRGLRKRVALKRLLPHVAENHEVVRAFIQEARLVGYLRHPNIAQTYDFGKVDDTYFMAMELVPGPTLTQLIRQCKATVGIVPFPITLNILGQVCDALAYAHSLCDEEGRPLDLVHRDISPPNIIVSATGVVKLIDFGVAKVAGSSLQTKVGTVKGKFSYMAPEYLIGQLDHRVDLWALGVVAYELLTNQQLFDAPDNLAVLERVRHAPIPPPSRRNPDVPRDLDAVVLTALERDPDRRWRSAAAMRTALAHVATELTVTNAQMIEWIEWAFTMKPGMAPYKSGASQLIELIERPYQPRSGKPVAVGSMKVRTDESGPARSAPTKPAPTKPAPVKPARSTTAPAARVGASMVQRHGGAGPFFWWLVVLLFATAIGAAVYRYGVPSVLTDAL
jgi:eukaryotic-like serine/threonine-protein kinase